MSRKLTRADYPPNWDSLATAIKEAVNWTCVRCHHPNDRKSAHVLTVHHLDGDTRNNLWWNTIPLCQRCHLSVQQRVQLDLPFVFEHSDWFKPYIAAYYAVKYLGLDLDRDEVEQRLDELLELEVRAILGGPPLPRGGAS